MDKGCEMQRSVTGEWFRKGALIALTTVAIAVAGCGGGGSSGGGSAGGEGSANPAAGAGSAPNSAPTISGSPAAQVTAGAGYVLVPTAQDADGDVLAFTIENRPAWASFDTTTGKLSGTPGVEHAGTSNTIVISVSDGKASAALPPFTVTVMADTAASAPEPAPGVPAPTPTVVDGNAVALSWDVPTISLKGKPVADLAGYLIHYGTHADVLAYSIEVKGSGSNTFVVQDLQPGVYYFAVRAVTSNGTHSTLSNIITRKIS